ncbi:acyl-CoA thioesterase II [Methylobacterium soli]|uniref:Acyl-CoA thioesterase 2 n=1 Tax=Methylobacterium soli TaxID=553447 RepID=A0A6L3T0H7_9HYPH|nr:acyl-CoA thioesterase II [Methylobacterium soli]KAB1080016.1 acyl-CoA thioesterase II [Methylobacterium soli]GJE43298.1 Acyl-CoA thioesterase 2 [Methylobacterium soli]
MTGIVAELLDILDLERLEVDLFRGVSPNLGWPRVFGGQVVAQALVAATRTVPSTRPPHSLHAYFLLGGDPKVPIIYEVERIRDGRSFTTRRVKAIQHGRAIFAMSISYQDQEDGHAHQARMPDAPDPDTLPETRALVAAGGAGIPAAVAAYFARERPIELKPASIKRYLIREPRDPRCQVWLRAASALPDDPAIHQAVLAYASDMTLLDATLIAHGRTVFDPEIQSASLDHALWFHRPFRADEWLLYAQDSPTAAGARGFARGQIFNRAGELVASVAQEGLIRPRDDRA